MFVENREMDDMKKITIGITTFNNKMFLNELLYTISEELKNDKELKDKIEIMIYDDGSSDTEIVKTLREYETMFTLVKSFENSGGPSRGRNHIINNAKSEYLLFIDGDDTLVSPIRKIYEEIKSQDIDLFVSDVTKIFNDGFHGKSPFLFSNHLFSGDLNEENIKKISVHQTGIWSIYKVSFLRGNGIFYKEDIRYEDNYFMTTIYLKNPKIKILQTKYYGWRNNFTSFTNSDSVVKHRIKVYEKILQLLSLSENKSKPVSPWLFYSIWNQTYVNIIRNYPEMNNKEFKKYFVELERISLENKKIIRKFQKELDDNFIDVYTRMVKKIGIAHNFLIMNLLRKVGQNKKRISEFKSFLARIFFILPMDRQKTFFTSHYGDFNDNSKYLYLEMKASVSNKNNKFIFAVKNPEELNQKYKTNDFIDYDNKIKFFYHHYTSKNIFFDSWYSPLIKKRRGQSWTQLWHGIPYKKVYTDVNTYKMTNAATNQKKKSDAIANWDYVWSVNEYNTQIFSRIFPRIKIIQQEYPKTNWLIKNVGNDKIIEEVILKHNLNRNHKMMLYAPTYRPYKVYLDILEIMKFVSDDEKLLIHMHPLMNCELINLDKIDRARVTILDKIEDIQELILCTNGLITDYSSIRYDYEQVNFPVFFYTPDKKIYDLIHGLY